MFVEELLKTFAKRRSVNKAYSLRAFARDLRTNPATLSAILNRKRPLTLKTALRLTQQLDWSSTKKRKIISQFTRTQDFSPSEEFKLIPDSHGEVLSRWETFAILSLLEIPPLRFSAREIAQKLESPFGEILVCLGILEQHGYVHEARGKWTLNKIENRCSTTDVPSSFLRKGHKMKTLRGLVSLNEDPVSVRDFTDITMAIDPAKLPEAKQRIKEFRRELSSFLEEGAKEQVYQLNVQLFPLSHRTRI